VDRRLAFADKTTTQTDRRRNQHYHQRYILHDEAPDSLVFTGHAGSTKGLWLTIIESGRVLVRLAASTPYRRPARQSSYSLCLLRTSDPGLPMAQWRRWTGENQRQGCSVKKAALALALVVAALSLGGCFVGKGKAPAPIVTKG
jgi:hypothetical protein